LLAQCVEQIEPFSLALQQFEENMLA